MVLSPEQVEKVYSFREIIDRCRAIAIVDNEDRLNEAAGKYSPNDYNKPSRYKGLPASYRKAF